MSIREKALAAAPKVPVEIFEDPDLGPVVLRHPGFLSLLKLNKLGEVDRLVFMVMNFVFEPVLGPDGVPLQGEDGKPLVGKPAFDRADEEVLRTTDHEVDGWFVRLIGALNAFIERTNEASDVGKKSAGG